jgi:Protein of unknown function (DUF1565)
MLIWPCTTRAAIVNNTIRNCASGVAIDESADGSLYHFTINKNSFSRLWVNGLFVWGSTVSVDELNDNTFTQISGAFGLDKTRVAAALSLTVDLPLQVVKKARRNIITDNDQGLSFYSTHDVVFGPDGPVDFGQPGDPGGNVFRCNSSHTGSGGSDLVVSLTGSGTIPLYGNTWDHFPPTTAPSTTAANGTDIGVPDTSVPGLGTDFGQADTTPCPSGHTAGP